MTKRNNQLEILWYDNAVSEFKGCKTYLNSVAAH